MESDDDELFVAALDSFEAAPGRPAGCDNAQAHGGSVTVQQPRPHPQPLRTANGAGGGVGGGGDGGGVRSLFIGKRGCGAGEPGSAHTAPTSTTAQPHQQAWRPQHLDGAGPPPQPQPPSRPPLQQQWQQPPAGHPWQQHSLPAPAPAQQQQNAVQQQQPPQRQWQQPPAKQQLPHPQARPQQPSMWRGERLEQQQQQQCRPPGPQHLQQPPCVQQQHAWMTEPLPKAQQQHPVPPELQHAQQQHAQHGQQQHAQQEQQPHGQHAPPLQLPQAASSNPLQRHHEPAAAGAVAGAEQHAAVAAVQPAGAAQHARANPAQQAVPEAAGAGRGAAALQQAQPEPAPAQQAAPEPAASPAAPAPAEPAAAQQAAQQPAPSKAAQQPAPSKAAQHPAPSKPRRLKQLFDYLLVLDIEATCDRDKAAQLLPQEIIELSCVIVDTAACSVRPGSWQCYVKPDQHPVLTEFCTELTGITQAQVDAGVPLKTALEQLDAWLREQGLIGQGKTFSPLTWRDWDLKVMMASECKWRKIEQPKYLRRWIDLSAVWFKHSTKRGNLRASVEAAGLAWQGRAHSAIDDAFNTARLAVKLMQGGLILGITGSFGNLDASGRFKQGTLLGLATAGAKGAAGSGVGGGAASGSGASGQAQGAGQLAGGPKKKRVFDDSGAWNGCCYCGARAKKRTVKRPGPNNGRDFWSCGRFTMTGGAGCDFFKFVDDVSAPPAVASGGGGRQRRR